MIPQECRDLLNLYLDTARTTDIEASATASLDAASGMLGYAITRGDLTPQEHSNEWVIIKLIRAQRRNKINAERAS